MGSARGTQSWTSKAATTRDVSCGRGTGGSARQSRHVRTDFLLFLRHLGWLGMGTTGKSGWDKCGAVLGCYVAERRNRKGHSDEAEGYINKRRVGSAWKLTSAKAGPNPEEREKGWGGDARGYKPGIISCGDVSDPATRPGRGRRGWSNCALTCARQARPPYCLVLGTPSHPGSYA